MSQSRPDFDWRELDGVATSMSDKKAKSYYRKYLVDENERTFEEVKSVELPYSPYVSCVQETPAGTIAYDSGMSKTFGEKDHAGEDAATFTMEAEQFIYRVLKYDFKEFYFAG